MCASVSGYVCQWICVPVCMSAAGKSIKMADEDEEVRQRESMR
jgi:hypothetical protein